MEAMSRLYSTARESYPYLYGRKPTDGFMGRKSRRCRYDKAGLLNNTTNQTRGIIYG